MKEAHTHTGLSEAEVLESRRLHGSNLVTPPRKTPAWRLFLAKFSDPLIVILLIAGALSVGIACYEYAGLDKPSTVFFEPVGIFVAILLATGLAFILERQADKEFKLLNRVSEDEPVQVIRSGNVQQVPRRDIVVGDVALLETGAEVPADGELLEATGLSVDESTLTGEPVCRKSTRPEDFDPEATFPTRHVLKGTKVMEGHGLMRVTAVGDKTENGKVFVATQIDNSVRTPLNEQLDRLGKLITNLSYCIAGTIIVAKLLFYFHWHPLSLLILLPTAAFIYLVIRRFKHMGRTACIATLAGFLAVFLGGVVLLHEAILPREDLSGLLAYTLQTLMIAVTLIVVSVPEGLPMAVTLSLAYSMRRMLKTNNLVRKMHACETMGAATVICTDKTGTLTQNQMRVGRVDLLVPDGETEERAWQLLCENFALNSTAQLDLAQPGRPVALGNPTEGALLLWLHEHGTDYRRLRQNAHTMQEEPFSTERKYMAVAVQTDLAPGRTLLYVKGAPEIVMARCRNTAALQASELERKLQDYQSQAMRTLGFAYKVVDNGAPVVREGDIVGSDLTFLGIAAISDPVRPDVPEAVERCIAAGIDIKIVTGDTPATAKEIGRQIGLWTEDDTDRHLITGPEFAALDDAEAAARVAELKIIARARPMDKKRLVEILQARGEVVAVTGDGTNDAPALKAAHVGLSMGDGTSVAKEASDITIIDNSFTSISRAVMWGRSLYRNIQRFLLFQLTVNVAACCIVLAGAFMGQKSPLTVTQMLWVNLIMDSFGAVALASLPPSESVMRDKPRNRKDFIISRDMAADILGVGGFFFLLMFGFLYVFEHTDIGSLRDLLHATRVGAHELTPYESALLFTIFVMTHFWYMFNARAFRTNRSGLRLKGCKGFFTIAVITLVGQVVIVEAMGSFFDVVPLKLEDWLLITVLSSLVLWVREAWHQLRKRLCANTASARA